MILGWQIMVPVVIIVTSRVRRLNGALCFNLFVSITYNSTRPIGCVVEYVAYHKVLGSSLALKYVFCSFSFYREARVMIYEHTIQINQLQQDNAYVALWQSNHESKSRCIFTRWNHSGIVILMHPGFEILNSTRGKSLCCIPKRLENFINSSESYGYSCLVSIFVQLWYLDIWDEVGGLMTTVSAS